MVERIEQQPYFEVNARSGSYTFHISNRQVYRSFAKAEGCNHCHLLARLHENYQAEFQEMC